MSRTPLAESHEQVGPATIRRRGAVGAALLTIRAAAAQAVAFLGTLVLTHMLSPREFGVVAFGITIVTIGNFLSDGGLGVALIRKASDPTVDELRTLLGFQLLVGSGIAVAVGLVGSRDRDDRSGDGRHGVLAAVPLPRPATSTRRVTCGHR